MIYDYQDYRAFLRESLQKTIGKNPLFSLRAMANQIGVSPSTLSSVMTGKRNLSPDMAVKVAKTLKLSARHTDYLLTLVQLENAKSDDLKAVLRKKVEALVNSRKSKSVNADLFSAISEWYHAAIIELTTIFSLQRSDKNLVASELEITPDEAEAAIERLIKLNLLRETENGILQKCDSDFVVSSPVPNTALRFFHQTMLQKASSSLETQSPQERLIGSETFAISGEDLEKLEGLMEDFFSQAKLVGTAGTKPDQLYHLGVQCFRLNRPASNNYSRKAGIEKER